MKDYYMIKSFDLTSEKNIQEDETRNETIGTKYFNIENEGIRSVHSKKKEFK